MGYVVTDADIERARKKGKVHAIAEHELGNTEPLEVVLDESDQRHLVWKITGQKLGPEDNITQELVSAYEDGYFDEWEDYKNG